MSKILPIASSYTILVSALYLMGFWSELNINFLEYITLTEVAVISIGSLISSFGLLLLSSFISEIYIRPVMPIGGGRDTPEGKFMRKWWKVVYFPLIILAAYTVYSGKPMSSFFLAIVISPVLGIWFANTGFLSDVISNDNVRYSIVLVAVQIAFFSFPIGEIKALELKSSEVKNQVKIEEKTYTYLGKLGNNVFLWDNNMKHVKQLSYLPKEIIYIP